MNYICSSAEKLGANCPSHYQVTINPITEKVNDVVAVH